MIKDHLNSQKQRQHAESLQDSKPLLMPSGLVFLLDC